MNHTKLGRRVDKVLAQTCNKSGVNPTLHTKDNEYSKL